MNLKLSLIILAAMLASPALAASKQPQPADEAIDATQLPTKQPPADQQEMLLRASKYLSALQTLQAQFTQVAPDGSTSSGAFYLKKPGKMRWQYAPPSPVLLVSDGKTLVFYDAEMEQVTYIPIDDTIASFLARETINFSDPSIELLQVEASSGALRIILAQKGKPEAGTLTLEFTDTPFKLRNLVVRDAANQQTHIALDQARENLPLDDALFIFKDPRKRRK